ncbi:MFS transporter [Pseudokordiimonas caeni]|uniref:MFS transporter n=1 Tax=Pseudokordiimonas caeni TaxID=2997908 RepID=UPI00281245F2|nr:glycoside-pentoside-hexuronide (GPH):cation symporter [Pseudokordiimonas caeni]
MAEQLQIDNDARGTPLKPFIGFGLGDYALNLFWQGVGFFLFFFETNVVGLSGTVVGTLFLIASIWDAVTDPIMGFIAERTRSRFGPYRPYLLFGCVPLAIMFALMFTPVRFPEEWMTILYTLIVLLLFRTTYTIVSIPYSTLGARITQNFDGRTRLAGIRMYFGFLGGLSISYIAKHLQAEHSDAVAFSHMGIAAGVLAVIVLVACFALTDTHEKPEPADEVMPGLGESLSAMMRNRPFMLVIGGIMLVTVANSIVGQTMLYFFESTLGNRTAGNNAIIIMGAAPLITIPFWALVALKIGKRFAWILGCLTGAAGLMMLYFDRSGSIMAAYGAVIVIVIGLSSFAVLFWSALPDTIEYGQYLTGIKIESFLIGMASSFQKVTIGLSAFVAGILLDMIGYQAGADVAATTADGIRNIFTLIPAAALLGSAFVILFYPVTAQSHAAIVAKLREMKP